MEASVSTDRKQFLVFKLDTEDYGIDINKITTIIEKDMIIARVPDTPEFVKGVINLRGEIIPVIELRKRFNLPSITDTENTRIIIIRIEDVIVGLIVDEVVEVVMLDDDDIESLANFSNDFSMDYISGAGKVDGRIVTILKLEKLISI